MLKGLRLKIMFDIHLFLQSRGLGLLTDGKLTSQMCMIWKDLCRQ